MWASRLSSILCSAKRSRQYRRGRRPRGRRQLAILTRPDAQLVFVDTPGIHTPRHKLGEYLNQEAEEALRGNDIVLWIIDATQEPSEDDRRIATLLKGLPSRVPQVMAANKMDLLSGDQREAAISRYKELLKDGARVVEISALQSQGLQELVSLLISLLPVRPAEFEEDQITDLYEREIAADLIREVCAVQAAGRGAPWDRGPLSTSSRSGRMVWHSSPQRSSWSATRRRAS